MSEVGKKLKTVLEGYAKFLRDRGLAPPKQKAPITSERTRTNCPMIASGVCS